MYSAYCNRTTPFFAFLEGMVRMFDWGGLVELRKSRSGRDTEDDRGDDGWNDRIVDWYIRDSIASFEIQEAKQLSGVPFLPRRSFAVANILLGPLPTQNVILRYEEAVPGACDRIMQRAKDKLDHDGQAELHLLRERAKQGYLGMAAGFLLTMLLAFGAFFLFLFGHHWEGLSIAAIIPVLVVAASAYISGARVRKKLYTREFFSRSSRPTLIY